MENLYNIKLCILYNIKLCIVIVVCLHTNNLIIIKLVSIVYAMCIDLIIKGIAYASLLFVFRGRCAGVCEWVCEYLSMYYVISLFVLCKGGATFVR